MEVFPVDIDYTVVDEKPWIRIFCIDVKGERSILYDDSFRPYCYVKGSVEEVKALLKDSSFVTGIEKAEKKLLRKDIEVCRVFTKLPEDVPKIRNLGLQTYDADIPFYKRYILDTGISSFTRVDFSTEGDKIRGVRSIADSSPPFKQLAFDIEVLSDKPTPDPRKDPVVAISLFNYSFSRIITWLDTDIKEAVKVADEKELLMKFAEIVSDYNPDVLIGYNSDEFDLPYIEGRARALGLDLRFNGFNIKVKGTSRKMSEINGKVHVDIYNFIRNIYAVYNLKTETLKLDAVANEMLGEKKDEFDWTKVKDILRDRSIAGSFCRYCLKDSSLTFKIYDRLYALLEEISRGIGQMLQDVSRMTTGAVVEHYIMRMVVKENEVIPNKPSDFEVQDRLRRINVGAFVYQPRPGMYQDVGIVDFRSLYPSIIISHNICPSTIKHDGEHTVYKSKEEVFGLIPSILSSVLNARIDAKSRLKFEPENNTLRARVSVLKLIANGFFGYLGYYNARWYCFECAGSILSLGREYVNKVIDAAEKGGFKVIYADTDSAFLSDISKEQMDRFLSGINSSLPPPMELELQGMYRRALFVSVKGKEKGAKKKYALYDQSGNLIVKGFQTVRRDWALIAKESQYEVLRKILAENDPDGALNYIKQVISDIRSLKVPLEKMVIFTKLHKEAGSYKQMGRHVSAALSSGVKFSAGEMVKYIIIKGRQEETVSQRSILFDIARENNMQYDPDYYINQQVIPAVLPIFEVIGFSEADITGKKNVSLDKF
ncbi:MAG: DNA-directed DNA polymerase [Candidatus Parvarchaeota archaeon]|nr:DNA-directed DNA polymerase [Candidatus Parvarchaeota archaeon]MCW1301826.1 DNA-directed DNA polymerase [Candidatus Parvarchaeota archaeon]